MLDLKRTIDLILGALFNPEATWRSYLPEAGDWKKTALLLTGPLVVAAAIVSYLLGLMRGDAGLLGTFRPTLVSTLLGIVMLAIAAAVVAFVFSVLAAAFRGKNNFALGLAATTLAFVPGYLGSALSSLPWIGFLVSLGLFIYALVLLWRIIPIYLEVPAGSRAGHYIVSLVVCAGVMFTINLTIGGVLYGGTALSGLETSQRARSPGTSERAQTRSATVTGGIAGRAMLLAAAEEDTYAPPPDGRLTEAQVQAFIRVMQRTAELLAEVEADLQDVATRAENQERLSVSDFSRFVRGATELAGIRTTEIEVVKTGGGNWAEHQWVQESLRTAWVQREGSPAITHNYALYMKYQNELAEHIAH